MDRIDRIFRIKLSSIANNFGTRKITLSCRQFSSGDSIRVIDSGQTADIVKLRPFEGMWLATKPSGAVVCAKIINGKLLIPHSFSEEQKLAGHYYDCRVIEKTLFCRFEHFDSAVAGVLFLTAAANETLKGGRWMNNQISESVRQDISGLSEVLPGMQSVVWIRTLNKQTPQWAEKYFHEDWPNKPLR